MSSLSSLKSSCAGSVGAFYIVKSNDESVIELSVFIDRAIVPTFLRDQIEARSFTAETKVVY